MKIRICDLEQPADCQYSIDILTDKPSAIKVCFKKDKNMSCPYLKYLELKENDI